MKKKPLSYYLDLMKSAQDKSEWVRIKKYGEIALKKLSTLSYSPFEEYLLYNRLGYTYGQLAEYSHSLDVYYKAELIASKNHLSPAYIAYASHMLGYNFLMMRNINHALRQFQKVEQYYQKYGDGISPMNKENHFLIIVGLGHCYLYKNNLEEVKKIIEQELSGFQSVLSGNTSIAYHHLKGEYLMAVKEYNQARRSFQECIKIRNQLNVPRKGFETIIHLATVELLDNRLESAIQILESFIHDIQRFSGVNDLFCEAGLLLSKSYSLNNMPDKASFVEKRIKPILNKLDITWLYEKTREFEQLYRKLQPIYRDEGKPVSTMLSHTVNKHYEKVTHKIIGQSVLMKEIYLLIDKIAPTDLPILIQGETGTGKELVARAIYNSSLRKGKMWLATNCGALAESLLENELFGHNKGAFTDAQGDKKGYIELASEGTLFLDEISEMSPAMQQKLLRVLEDKLVWRLGAEKPIPVNTRFIFASNQNIEELVKAKRFREDLYYRINTIVITLPPLRDRKEDIPLLVKHFMEKYSRVETLRYTQGDQQEKCHSEGVKRPKNLVEITPSTLDLLVNYNWPGNVRELENEIKRICALYPDAKTIAESMLLETIKNYKPVIPSQFSLKESRDFAERNTIIEALKKCNNNITHSARLIGCRRQYLQRKMKRLKIEVTTNFVTKK